MLWPWLCCNIDFYSQYSPPLVSLSRDVETTHGLSREPPKTPFHLQLPLAPLVHWSTLVHTGPLVPPGTKILFSAASCATWSSVFFVIKKHLFSSMMASTSPHPEVQFFGRSLDIINPKHTQIAKWYEILLLFWRWWLPSQHSHFGEVPSWEQTEAFQKVQVNFQTVSPENNLQSHSM